MSAPRRGPRGGLAGLAAAALALASCARSGAASAVVAPGAGGAIESDPPQRIEAPPRRSAGAAPEPPPELPAALAAPIELTLSLERRGAGPGGRPRRETIARSADRVHIERAEEGIEWLFVRNPRDPRRVAARLVDHRQRAIVDYAESELRSSGVARGWADVAALGARLDTLAALEPTGRVSQRSGLSFVELAPQGGGTSRLWWSEAGALALALAAEPMDSVELLSLERGVDASRLLEPRLRYPHYAAYDVADYRELRHADAPDRADAHRHGAHR